MKRKWNRIGSSSASNFGIPYYSFVCTGNGTLSFTLMNPSSAVHCFAGQLLAFSWCISWVFFTGQLELYRNLLGMYLAFLLLSPVSRSTMSSILNQWQFSLSPNSLLNLLQSISLRFLYSFYSTCGVPILYRKILWSNNIDSSGTPQPWINFCKPNTAYCKIQDLLSHPRYKYWRFSLVLDEYTLCRKILT